MTGRALARSTDPVESHIAAASVDVEPFEARVLEILCTFGTMNGNDLNDQYRDFEATK